MRPVDRLLRSQVVANILDLRGLVFQLLDGISETVVGVMGRRDERQRPLQPGARPRGDRIRNRCFIENRAVRCHSGKLGTHGCISEHCSGSSSIRVDPLVLAAGDETFDQACWVFQNRAHVNSGPALETLIPSAGRGVVGPTPILDLGHVLAVPVDIIAMLD